VAFSLYNLQFLYYAFGLALLALGLGWLVAAVNVFHRDLGQALNIVLQAWFWLTPIIWGLDMVPEKYRVILKLNPLSYIAEGYKSSFLFRQSFWGDLGYGLYFWAFTAVVLFIGAVVFIRLKPEFADVL
jgi:lipopolysaccharide transport system permease protein/teichoic acid transport system permease protein